MIKIDFENLKNSDIDFPKIREMEKKIPFFLKSIAEKKVGFCEILDQEILETEQFFKLNKNFEEIVILGIGGSSLGAKAIINFFDNFSEKKITILDSVDPDFLQKKSKKFSDQTLFLVISKSGKTPETIAQFSFFAKKFPKKNFVFVSDNFSPFQKISQKWKVPFFEIPQNLGGRFSVLSPVGLLVVSFLGISISEILQGAKKMRKKFFSKKLENNLPFFLAVSQFLVLKAKKTQHVFWGYSKKFFELGKWWQQLIAESTGKNKIGITPIVAEGPSDQHSLLQLFIDGPKDKFFIFLQTEKFENKNLEITPMPFCDAKFLEKKSFQKLLDAEKIGTEKSLVEKKIPCLTIKITEFSAENLGGLFFLFQGCTAFLGEFLKINAFDQPGVERGKKLTRKILEN